MKEKYSEFISKLTFQRDMSLIREGCWNCRSLKHWILDCDDLSMWRPQAIEKSESIELNEFNDLEEGEN